MELMSQRQLKVCRLLQRSLGELLALSPLHDSAINHILWTISDVTISPDLRNARIYVVANGQEKDPVLLKKLNEATPLLKKRLAPKLNLRFMPRLVFVADTSFENSSSIDSIIKNLRISDDA